MISKLAAIMINLLINNTNNNLDSPNIKIFIVGFTASIKLINIPSGPRKIPNKNPFLIDRFDLYEIFRFCNPKIIRFNRNMNKGINTTNGASPINKKVRIFIMVFLANIKNCLKKDLQ